MRTDRSGMSGARLLPWAGTGGKSCYLVTDGTGYVSRLADDIESVQLGMAVELLGHAADMLADHRATAVQLRFLLARMTESLTDVHRVAESRGERLAVPVSEDEDEGEGEGEGEDEGEDEGEEEDTGDEGMTSPE